MPGRAIITYASRKRTYAESLESDTVTRSILPTPPSSTPLSWDGHHDDEGRQTPSISPTSSQSTSEGQDDKSQTKSPLAAKAPPLKRQKLVQTTIDLGGNPQKCCKDCGMEYIPSNAEDAKLHKDFHAASVGGVDVPAGWRDKWKVVATCAPRAPKKRIRYLSTKRNSDAGTGRDIIVEVTAHDKPTLRKWAKRALEVVEKDLGAVETAEKALWQMEDTDNGQRERFKTYLFVHRKKCIGFCLTERIAGAAQLEYKGVLESPVKGKNVPADVGISRIWVSKEYRRLGIARELLNAVEEFAWTGPKTRELVMAFSQPTDNGTQLARAWFGKGKTMLVYDQS